MSIILIKLSLIEVLALLLEIGWVRRIRLEKYVRWNRLFFCSDAWMRKIF